MESLLLSCRALSSPTTCRFIPAHSVPAPPRKRYGLEMKQSGGHTIYQLAPTEAQIAAVKADLALLGVHGGDHDEESVLDDYLEPL